jgi:hypothetical protein
MCLFYIKEKDSQCTYSVTLLLFRVTSVAMETDFNFTFIFELHVAFKNITLINATTETKEWFPFVLLSSYKIFRSAIQQNRRT